MSLIVLDRVAAAKLTGRHDPVKVCDDTGRVLGHFVPAGPLDRIELEPPPLDPEELARRTSRTGGRTLAEIMADLGQQP